MEYLGAILTILSHILAGLYLERPKHNKIVTVVTWLLFAFVSICILALQQNPQITFFGLLFAKLIAFFVSAKGKAGEKLFLFLTYSNAFCTCVGAGRCLIAFLGESVYLPVIEAVMLVAMHLLLYKALIPTYKRAKIFFDSGWLKINLILTFFFIQFLNQYIFTVVDEQSAVTSGLDFVVFAVIFYSILFFIFNAVKNASEINKKTFENNELKNIAYVDELTGLGNRRAYIKYTRKQTQNYRKNKNLRFLSVVMDIDDFKEINDDKGHAEGDRILKEIGAFMAEHFKNFACKIFRFGGDEFILLSEEMNVSDLAKQMETMNETMLATIGTRMSYGWAKVELGKAKPFEEAFKKADKIMYDHKQQRNVGR